MDTADNTPLNLDELDIPGSGPAHPPAPADSVGINIAAAWLNFPHQGLRLILPSWPNMGLGDAYRVKLGNIPVLTGDIREETEVDQPVVTHIPVGQLIDGDFDLSYEVKILGAPGYTPSAVTKIHVKIDFAPPGGQDQDGDTPGHSELKLTIPIEFLPPGAVDQEAARQGVPVTIEPYPIMAEGDRIKLSWGGETVWKTVEAQHLPPQNIPLVITVDEATILKADDTDANGLAVVFEVYDVVDNKSEDWSAEVRVIVDTGNSRLPAPLIKEVFNLVLDMDQLGEADLTFQVVAVDANFFKADDEVEMHLAGITAEGEKIEEVIYTPEKILSVPSILEFKRSSAEVRQLAGGPHAAFFYRLIKADGSDDLSSKIFSPRIVGRANPLAAPIPLDEIAGTLDPQLPSTTIEIPLDPAMEEGNAIALIWNGTEANGTSYMPDFPLHPLSKNEAEGSVPIEIVVAGEHLTAIEGGTLDLYYKLLRDAVSREVIEDESLHADLLRIGIPQAELPLPVVEGESDGILDPADKPDGTRLIVRQYGGQKAGDRVHILWWGSITGRYRDSIPVTEFTENQDIPFTISAALIEGNRDGTVQAMYWVKRVGGGTSASEILHINIGAQAIPTLDNVKDANGGEIPENTDTVTASVSVNGTASKGRNVEIYDGGGASAVLKGTETADPVTGIWSLANIAVAVGGHRFYAKALYYTGGTPYSNVRLFTVTPVVTPTITSVKDPQDSEIANGGTTTATTVTLRGKASNNQQVEIFDGSTSKGTAPVNANGDWSKQVTGLSVATHSFTAKGLYGSNPVSTARTLTVIAVVTPTITSVKDPQETEIANGGTTTATTVTLRGKASNNQQVEIFDGTTSKGTAPVNANGDWSKQVTGLSMTTHSFTAKGLYGNNPVSTARTLTVVAVVTPTITSVRDPQETEIANGGTTTATTVTLRGKASNNQQVEIFDGTTSKGTAPVNANGDWSKQVTGLSVTAHSFTAKALYGGGETSAPYTFTVNPAIPDLVIDPSPVNLSAVHHRSHVTPTHPPAGAYVDRVASGGVPPYGYSSSNPDVAEVNASTGRVISKGSGSATITARDQSGKTASYTVHCANIRWYFGYTRGNYFNSNAWVQGQGGTLPTEAEHAALRTNYGGNGLTAGIGNSDISRNWIPDPGGAPLGQKYVIDPRDGRKFTIMDFGGPSGASANADGYGVKNK